MIAPFNRDGEWLRCQLHSHTTNSDGEATADGLIEHYVRAGFDVLAITDHWHITTAAHDELVLLPSSELSARLEGRGDFDADVLAYGIDVLPEPRRSSPRSPPRPSGSSRRAASRTWRIRTGAAFGPRTTWPRRPCPASR